MSELHGSLKTVSCLKCQSRFDSRQLLPKVEGGEASYQNGSYHHGTECRCSGCGGLLRPDVVLFGESLPEDAWKTSQEWSHKADLFVVIGSSLVVSPANYLPQMAVEADAKLLIINQEPTPLDHLATWCLRTKAAETLPAIVAAMNESPAGEIQNCEDKEELMLAGGLEGGGLELFGRTFSDGRRISTLRRTL